MYRAFKSLFGLIPAILIMGHTVHAQPENVIFKHYSADQGLNSTVRAIFQDRQGFMWFGRNNGITRFDGYTFRPLDPAPDDPDSFPGGDPIRIMQDRDGLIWVGTGWEGMNRYNQFRNTFQHLEHDPNDPGSLSNDDIVDSIEDRQGVIWILTVDGILNRFNQEDNSFSKFSLGIGRWLTGNQYGGALYEDHQGDLWIGARGLHHFNQTSKSFVSFYTNTGRVTRFTEQNSDLPNNRVNACLEDKQGQLWISTEYGFARYDPATDTFRNFGLEDGLQGMEFEVLSHFRSNSGEMFFGGAQGVISFFPDQITENPYPPQVVLTDFRLFNESVPITDEGPLSRSITYTEQISLTYDQNDLSFEYAGLHYSASDRNDYAVMMQGYDEDWRDVGTQRTATYTALPPGSYVFRVRASSSDGVWNEEGASVRIMIHPPWWRTNWAYLLYVALLLGSLYMGNRLQRRRLVQKERQRAEREKARALEQINSRLEASNTQLNETLDLLTQTQDKLIHAEKMASLGELTAGIAHEIKNPLNFVNNFSELAVELTQELKEVLLARSEEQDGEIEAILNDLRQVSDKINIHGNRADSIVRAMMQHATGETGKLEETDINALVSSHIDLAVHGIRAQKEDFNISVERDLDEKAGAVEVVPQEIGRVLLNLLNNAFDAVSLRREQDGADFEPKVRVSTKRVENGITIQVQDNGPGIPEHLRNKIFEPFFTTKPTGEGNTGLGLSLSYDIITQGHGGEITVESENGRGATFVIMLPA